MSPKDRAAAALLEMSRDTAKLKRDALADARQKNPKLTDEEFEQEWALVEAQLGP